MPPSLRTGKLAQEKPTLYLGTLLTKEMIALPNDENRGILPSWLEYIFASIDKNLFTVTCSYYQSFQNKVFDFVGYKCVKNLGEIISGFYLSDLSHKTINSIEEVSRWLKFGAKNRIIKATEMNQQSSRSHSIIKLIIWKTTTLFADLIS